MPNSNEPKVHPVLQAAAAAEEKRRRARRGGCTAADRAECLAVAAAVTPAVLRAVAESMPPAWSGAPAWLCRLAEQIENPGGDK